MLKYVLVIFMVICTSCVTTNKISSPPSPDIFWQIYKERYVIHEYDCSNKASKYCRILVNQGYSADLLVTRFQGYDHAIVILKQRRGYLYIDPTHGFWTKDVKKIGKPLMIVRFEDRHSKEWGDEFNEKGSKPKIREDNQDE